MNTDPPSLAALIAEPAAPTAPRAQLPDWRLVVSRLQDLVRRISWQSLFPYALASVFVIAAGLRFVGLNWDASQHLHPDERFITMVVDRIRLPASVDQYFNTAQSKLNPYNNDFGSYPYGTVPLFFVRWLAELIQNIAKALPAGPTGFIHDMRAAASYDQVQLVGRALSGIADLATMWLVFLMGRRLFGRGVALLATTLAAFMVLQIQAAHFFTVESPLVLFTTAALFFAIRAAETNKLRDWALIGVFIGLAISTKISAALLVVVVPAAAWLLWYRTTKVGGNARRRRFLAEDLVIGMGVAAVMAMVTFRVAEPYAFVGPGLFNIRLNPKWLADLRQSQALAAGADYPPSVQWTLTPPWIWQFGQMFYWGLGPPLTVASLGGVLFAGWQFYKYTRRYFMHLIPVVWVGLNLLYFGPQFTKPLRYLLPIYPVLAVYGSYLLLTVWSRARTFQWPARLARLTLPSPRFAAGALLFLVVGYTVWYAFAFASIYTRPTTRVAASEWIFQHVPAGSYLAEEHWDDPLPLRIDGKDAFSIYHGVEFPLYNGDDANKRTDLENKLDQVSVIVESSDRLYGSIPKMPLHYPMTTRYYQALFDGELGFTKAAEFTSRPQLFGIQLNDDKAEELFTVYEHPKVTIFVKNADYSSAKVRSILDSVNLDTVVQTRPTLNRTSGLFFTPAEQAIQTAGGTWSQLFNRESLANHIPPIAWWFSIEVLGAIAFPLLFLALGRLFDGGWLLAKPAGLLLLAWVAWVPPALHIVTSTRREIALMGVVLALVGAAAAYAQRKRLTSFVRLHWRRIVLGEVLFLALWGVFFLIRTSTPDLWHPTLGGEKPMDFAFLNATIKSSFFPPYDPWFSGGYINYYYFGFVIVGTLIKLLGIVPAVGYNLSVPILPVFAGIGAFSVVASIVAWQQRERRHGNRSVFVPLGAGLVGVLLIAVIGNIGDVVLVVQGLIGLGGGNQPRTALPLIGGLVSALGGVGQLLTGHPLPFRIEWWYWNATRIVPDNVINEFPFFTFLYGDLHAHAISLPYQLLALAGAVAVMLPGDTSDEPRAAHWWQRVVSVQEAAAIALLGLTIGALRATNTWDYPTYLLLAGCALVLADFFRRKRITVEGLFGAGCKLVAVFAVATITFEPYTKYYATLYSSISRWTGPRTTLPQYLQMQAIFLFLITCFLVYELFNPGSRVLAARLIRLAFRFRSRLAELSWRVQGVAREGLNTTLLLTGAGVALTALLVLVAIVGRLWLPLVLVVLLAMSTLALFSPGTSATRRITNLLMCTGLALSLFVEFYVLNGDIGRMNTVFKLY
ncbi:MAG TPA: DUF2298 domain-containing protein, partial [Chloroflexota bacterium]|nr:DUF2298 domain-containing protein [Chloroflexota bacterium]